MIVVFHCEPVWGTLECIMGLFGLTRGKVIELAKSGTIRARKEKPDSRSARVVYRCADVKDWLDNEAPAPRAEAFEPRRGPGMPRTGDDGAAHAAEPSLATLADGHAGGWQ